MCSLTGAAVGKRHTTRLSLPSWGEAREGSLEASRLAPRPLQLEGVRGVNHALGEKKKNKNGENRIINHIVINGEIQKI